MLALTKVTYKALNTHLGISFAIVAIVMAVNVVWLSKTHFSVEVGGFPWVLVAGLVVLCGLPFVKFENVRTLALGFLLMAVAWPALRLFNTLTFASGKPIHDELLASWGALIGSPWVTYVTWLDAHPYMALSFGLTYGSLTQFSIAAFFAIALTAKPAVAYEYLLVFVVTAVVISLVGMFVPAYGACYYYSGEVANLRYLAEAGHAHFPLFDAYAAGQVHTLVLDNLPGMTTFPSFHTAMGIILIYGSRTRPLMLSAAITYSALMIAGTPVFGCHYIIDVVAGATLTVLVIVTVRLISAMSGPTGLKLGSPIPCPAPHR